MKLLYVIPTTIALGGCIPADAPTPPDVPQDSCGAEKLMYLEGKDQAVLQDLDLPGNTRLLAPDTFYTQDALPDRLNINTDEAGIITRIWCG